jgi:hypothetical protein
MPVLWDVFHSTRLVAITLKGAIRLKDVEDCIVKIMTPATLSYRKLVDVTEGSSMPGSESIVALAERVRKHAGIGPIGALAIVAASHEGEQQARLFKSLSVTNRPMGIFRELHAARAWLDAQPSHTLWPLLE